jgi:TolB-like protein/DNA-binding winged helix-turn-helix (wHTH) protein/Flp pilus assembly protein TadD
MDEDKAAGRVRFEGVELDLDGHRLRVNGTDVPLEAKAFAVLSLLVRHAGHVLTRNQILDEVWGHAHVTPSVLNRIITLLRQALGESPGLPRCLHTVHGVGYRFDLPASAVASSARTPSGLPAQTTASANGDPSFRANGTIAPAASIGATGNSLEPRRSPGWLRTAGWALPLLVVLACAGWLLWRHASTHVTAPPVTATAPTLSPKTKPGIAVLPLANASGDPGQQFFSDGLSDNLIDALAKIDGVEVIGHVSSFRFRDSHDDSKSIGAKLRVAYLVSGSVQHVGDMVRIGVELSSTRDGRTIWAEHYDRPYKDLFKLQDEITQAVAGVLQAKLASHSEAVRQDDRPPGGDIEAYSAYLQGLKSSYDQDFAKAADYFAKAVQLDPDYAMAWALLSGSLGTVAIFREASPAVALEQMRTARAAADKALQLAPGLGPAHAARAHLDFYNFDYRSALVECRRAAQLAPDDGTVLFGCAYTLAGIGKLGEAMRLREHLLVIEPLYDVNVRDYASLLTATGRLDEAAKYLGLAESLAPPESPPSIQSMNVALVRGDAQAAQDATRNMPLPWRELYTAIAMQIAPDRAAADVALAKVLASKTWTHNDAYPIAQAYAVRGDPDKTMEWLERAQTREILFLLADPIILRFRDDPRLIAFCKNAGLPAPNESEALSIDQIRASLISRR